MKTRVKTAWFLLLPALAVVLALTLSSCGRKDAGDPVERAKQEIIESLVLPPDAKLKNTIVQVDQDLLVLSFGTKEKIDTIRDVFKKGVADRGYTIVTDGESMISYKDAAERQVTVMWFARDPDLSEFATVFHVSVQPLPPEIKFAAPAPKAKEK